MIYVLLIYEFLKIGFISFGGGYATIPFLYQISVQYGWYTLEELKQITAIAAITPGPVGINAATFAGYKTAGVFGSLCATVSEIIPSLILVIIISKILHNFQNNFYIKTAISILKPVSCALLLAVVIGLIKPSLTDLKGLTLLCIMLIICMRTKKDPLLYFIIAGIAGIIMNYSVFGI